MCQQSSDRIDRKWAEILIICQTFRSIKTIVQTHENEVKTNDTILSLELERERERERGERERKRERERQRESEIAREIMRTQRI